MRLVSQIRQFIKEDPERADLLRSLFYGTVCCLCIFAATLAWFHNRKESDVGGLELSSAEAVGFYVSLDGSNYGVRQTIEFPENLHLSPVSGDGSGSMYYPILPQGSNKADDATAWVKTDYDENAEENLFYRFTVYLRAYVPGYVVLSDLSVDPAAAPEDRQNADYTNAAGDTVEVSGTVTNPVEDELGFRLASTSSTITKDYIVAASRVSITNKGTLYGNIPKHFLVIPNGAMVLTDSALTDVNTGEQLHSLSMTENATGYANTILYHYDPLSQKKIEYKAESLPYYFGETISEQTPIYVLRLTKNSSNDLYEGKLDVTYWIEGYDEEALSIFADGKMKMSIQFDYVEGDAQ